MVPRMKIYTRLVLDAAGNTLEEESFEYQGPVALCGGGGGGTTINIPEPEPPSLAEVQLMGKQADLLDWQTYYQQQSMQTQNALAPYVYQQYGLKPIFEQFDTEQYKQDYEAAQAEYDAAYQQYASGTRGKPGYDQGKLIELKNKMEDLKMKAEGKVQPGITGFEEILRPGEITPQRAEALEAAFQRGDQGGASFWDVASEQGMSTEDIAGYQTALAQERSLRAMMGLLPVDPALQHEIDLSRRGTQEMLRKELGPGWETSTPGQETMDMFERRAMEMVQSFREGQISTSAAISQSQQQQQLQKAQSTFGQLVGSGGYPASGANFLGTSQAYNNPIGWYERDRERKYEWGKDNAMLQWQQQMFNRQQSAQSSAGIGKAVGSLGGLLFGMI